MEIELCKYFKENFVLVLFYFFILVVFAFSPFISCVRLSFRVINKELFDLVLKL